MEEGEGDLSQLLPPVATSINGIDKILAVYRTGTAEVQQMLCSECNIILECKKCRSLFRSLANFISHKRSYCCRPSHAEIGFQDIYTTVETISNDLAKRDLDHIVGNLHKKASQIGSDGLRGENPEASQRSQYFTAVAEAVKERRAARTDVYVALTPLAGTNKAMTQSVSKQTVILPQSQKTSSAEATATHISPTVVTQSTETPHQYVPAMKALSPDALKRSRGRPRKISADQIQSNSSNEKSSEAKSDVAGKLGTSAGACYPVGNYCCEKCNAQFTTQKSLNLHESTQHMTTRLQYGCPCCKSTFCNLWSTYRHLKSIHNKSQEQVEKMKAIIRKRAFRMTVPLIKSGPVISVPRAGSVSASKPLVSSPDISHTDRDWLGVDNNFTVDVGDHRCGVCGLKFERRAALVSHTNTCHRKPVSSSSVGPRPTKSPRSASPTSSRSSSVERIKPERALSRKKNIPIKYIRGPTPFNGADVNASVPEDILSTTTVINAPTLQKSPKSTETTPKKSDLPMPIIQNKTSPAMSKSPRTPPKTTSVNSPETMTKNLELKTKASIDVSPKAENIFNVEVANADTSVNKGSVVSVKEDSAIIQNEKNMENQTDVKSALNGPMINDSNTINKSNLLKLQFNPVPVVKLSYPKVSPTKTRPNIIKKILSLQPPVLDTPPHMPLLVPCPSISAPVLIPEISRQNTESTENAKPPQSPQLSHKSNQTDVTPRPTQLESTLKTAQMKVIPKPTSTLIDLKPPVVKLNTNKETSHRVIKLHRIQPKENGEKILCVKQFINFQSLNSKVKSAIGPSPEKTCSSGQLEDAMQNFAEIVVHSTSALDKISPIKKQSIPSTILVRNCSGDKSIPPAPPPPLDNGEQEEKVMVLKHAASASLPVNWFAAGSAERKWDMDTVPRSSIQVRRDYGKTISSESSCSPRPGSVSESSQDVVCNSDDSGGSEEDEDFEGWEDTKATEDDLQSRLGLPHITNMNMIYNLIASESSSCNNSTDDEEEDTSSPLVLSPLDLQSSSNQVSPSFSQVIIDTTTKDQNIRKSRSRPPELTNTKRRKID